MTHQRDVGSWAELGRHRGAVMVLSGGVLVAATSIYVAASVLPTVVVELGGEAFYAWNMTAFLVAQVLGTTVVARAVAALGNVRAYLAGFGLFTVGSMVCALSPVMTVMLIGRATQGLGAGLLTGLGFAVIYSALPQRLWGRGIALVSAMFGVGNIVGPAMGGLFAQVGVWRLAFVVLAVTAVGMAVLVPRVLPPGTPDGQVPALPVRSMALLVVAVMTVGVSGLVADAMAVAALVAAGLGLGVVFVVVERSGPVRLLPRSTYRGPSPLRWIYATIAVLASGVAVEMFLPLFGQELGGLPPVAAGVFAATLSLGWALSQIVSASITRPAAVRGLQVAGPACSAAGFAVLGLLQRPEPSLTLVLVWLPVVLVAGAGIGAAMPHLSVSAMTSATEPEEGDRAAAAIATVITLATAFGSAVAGVLVNLGAPDLLTSARVLLAGFAVLAGLGVMTAWRATGPGSARSTPTSRPSRW